MNPPVTDTHLFYIFLALLLSYLTGSFPSAEIAGRRHETNIREQGSGNPGTFNVLRLLGWKSAIAVFAADTAKGCLPVVIYAKPLFGFYGTDIALTLQILIGSIAILGHCYPLFGAKTGGKGVTTLGGVLLGVYPAVLPFFITVFAVSVIKTRYASLGSILASASLPIFLLLLPSFWSLQEPSLPLLVFSLLIPWFIIFTHRSNIVHIRNGTENKVNTADIFKKKGAD